MPILNDRQQQLIRDLVRLCESAQHKSFMYTPSFNNKDNIAAHGTSVKASASEKELKTLEHEGMIALKWVRHGAANGTVLQESFDAVRSNFAGMGDPAAVAAVAPPMPGRGAPAAAPARTNFIPMREGAAPHAPPIPGRTAGPVAPAPTAAAAPSHSSTDLVGQLASMMADVLGTLREVLPADEAEAAEADAAAIGKQLFASQPDPEIVARKTKSLVGRVTSAMGSAAEITGKATKLAEGLHKLSPFVQMVGHWAGTRRAA